MGACCYGKISNDRDVKLKLLVFLKQHVLSNCQ